MEWIYSEICCPLVVNTLTVKLPDSRMSQRSLWVCISPMPDLICMYIYVKIQSSMIQWSAVWHNATRYRFLTHIDYSWHPSHLGCCRLNSSVTVSEFHLTVHKWIEHSGQTLILSVTNNRMTSQRCPRRSFFSLQHQLKPPCEWLMWSYLV